MSNERVDAAARNLLLNSGKQMNAKDQAWYILKSADAVMFSPEALERAANAVHEETHQYFSGEGIAHEDAIRIANAVISALRGEAS